MGLRMTSTRRGRLLPSESQVFTDMHTGARVRQVTNHPSLHHHAFYYVPAYDNAMTRLFFISYRTGRAEVFCEIRATGELQQLTDRADLLEWSMHPSHDGRHLYYRAGTSACRVDVETLEEDVLCDLDDLPALKPGMAGSAIDTTTLSHDDHYWAVRFGAGPRPRLAVVDTLAGKHEVILEADFIMLPEFHPSDNTLLRYAGPHHSRIWVIRRNGTGNRLVYRRDEAKREWIVHETWNPARPREIITANWPHGCIGIEIDTGSVRPVCSFNAWHPAINRQGTLMCADTVYPDVGLQLFSPLDGVGLPDPLCFPEASSEGKHWDTDHCPYDDDDYKQGKWKVYAPQYTHPHPCFSPDGRFVVFTSDRTGSSQVYEVSVPEAKFPTHISAEGTGPIQDQ